MKQWICYIIALLTLWSCSQERDEPKLPAGDKIEFANSLVSKATTTTQTISDMGVFAYYTGDGVQNNWDAKGAATLPNVMDNISVSKQGDNSWRSATPAYWPALATDNTTFFAYSPYGTAQNGLAADANQTGVPKISYTATNPLDCIDLLVATPQKDLNFHSGSVGFSFSHILTQVTFEFKNAYDDTHDHPMKIASLRIEGDLYSTAQVNLETKQITSLQGTTSHYHKEFTTDMEQVFKWGQTTYEAINACQTIVLPHAISATNNIVITIGINMYKLRAGQTSDSTDPFDTKYEKMTSGDTPSYLEVYSIETPDWSSGASVNYQISFNPPNGIYVSSYIKSNGWIVVENPNEI